MEIGWRDGSDGEGINQIVTKTFVFIMQDVKKKKTILLFLTVACSHIKIYSFYVVIRGSF